MLRRLSFAFIGSMLLAGCTPAPETPVRPGVILRSPEGRAVGFPVEIADEPVEHERGLMFRDSLDPGTGMLFVFERPQPLSFWMKNTRVPLEILFFDRDGRFVSSASMEPCEADPCPSYRSESDAQYALEVKTGFLQTNSVGEGWILDVAP